MTEKRTLDITINNTMHSVCLSSRTGTRRLTLRIDGKTRLIHVSHPARCPVKRITDFVASQSEWIEKHLNKVPVRIIFAPGQSIIFEGIEHILCHVPVSRGIKVYDDREHKSITAECPHERFPRAIEMFMKREAAETIRYCAEEKAEIIGRKIKSVTVRDTKSRWGSCTSQGALSFSWRLIMAPPYVLDYLVAHEVAHLLHMNHSAAFWNTCANLSQDMAGAKIWLRKNGNLLHRFDTD